MLQQLLFTCSCLYKLLEHYSAYLGWIGTVLSFRTNSDHLGAGRRTVEPGDKRTSDRPVRLQHASQPELLGTGRHHPQTYRIHAPDSSSALSSITRCHVIVLLMTLVSFSNWYDYWYCSFCLISSSARSKMFWWIIHRRFRHKLRWRRLMSHVKL